LFSPSDSTPAGACAELRVIYSSFSGGAKEWHINDLIIRSTDHGLHQRSTMNRSLFEQLRRVSSLAQQRVSSGSACLAGSFPADLVAEILEHSQLKQTGVNLKYVCGDAACLYGRVATLARVSTLLLCMT
jgi:hypothetical protein